MLYIWTLKENVGLASYLIQVLITVWLGLTFNINFRKEIWFFF